MTNIFKLTFSILIACVITYLNKIATPIVILTAIMIIDYLTGMTYSIMNKQLNSRIGIVGIFKKMSYFILVITGGILDWVIYQGLSLINADFQINCYIGIVVAIWLIVNECISILENLYKIGVPLPSFLSKLVEKLKIYIERSGENE